MSSAGSDEDHVQRELDNERFKCRSLQDQLRRARDHDLQISEVEQILEARLSELREKRINLQGAIERTSQQVTYHEARAEELAQEVEISRPSSSAVLTEGPQFNFFKAMPLASRAAFALASTKPRSAPATCELLLGSQSIGATPMAYTLPGRLSDLLGPSSHAAFPGGSALVSQGFPPLALPHARADGCWVAPLQCLRHTPGFVAAVASRRPQSSMGVMSRRGAAHADGDPLDSLGQLFRAMASTQSTAEDLRMLRFDFQRCLPGWRGGAKSAAEAAGRNQPGGGATGSAMEPQEPRPQMGDAFQMMRQRYQVAGQQTPVSGRDAGDGRPCFAPPDRLPQPPEQRPSEFLQQLMQYLDGALADPAAAAAAAAAASAAAAALQTSDAGGAEAESYKVLFDYSVGQWAASPARLRSAILGDIFEGQMLTTMSCMQCNRYQATSSEPFTVHELNLASWQEEDSLSHAQGPAHGLLGGRHVGRTVPLKDLLISECEQRAPAGYCCPEPLCRQKDTSYCTTRYLRMPSVLCFHVNRECADGSASQATLTFPEVVDLNDEEHRLVAVFGNPFDRNLQPCNTRYELFGTVFQRGSGSAPDQYIAFVRSLVHQGEWCCFGDDSLEPHVLNKASTPMDLEASGLAFQVSMLFYARSDAEGASSDTAPSPA